MKKVIAGVMLAAASAPSAAADFGLGVSVQSDDSWIYAPIDITPRFRIEPSIRFQSFESSSRTELPFGEDIEFKQEGDQWEFAVGAFGLAPVADKLRLYYGARLAYIDSETEVLWNSQSERAGSDGYRISPTLGFEYMFSEHFSIGGEAEWFYQELDSEGSQSGPIGGVLRSSGELESNGTDTRLIVRFRF